MDDRTDSGQSLLGRRDVLRTAANAAWVAPAIMVGVAAPRFATSGDPEESLVVAPPVPAPPSTNGKSFGLSLTASAAGAASLVANLVDFAPADHQPNGATASVGWSPTQVSGPPPYVFTNSSPSGTVSLSVTVTYSGNDKPGKNDQVVISGTVTAWDSEGKLLDEDPLTVVFR